MLILECSNSDYWGPAFVVPLVSISVILIFVIIRLWNLIRCRRNYESLRKPMLQIAFGITTLIFIFIAHFPTFRYGVFLPTVSEEDRQYRQGCVTSVTPVSLSQRFSIQGSSETYRASLVQIDRDVFFFLTAEGLDVGQEIEITYLPRCQMVLSCQVVDQ